jgi:hypothetical protein
VVFQYLFLIILPPPSTLWFTHSIHPSPNPYIIMKLAAAVLAATAFVPMSAFAGMYGDPVINLDAKSFKKAMATEHAAVCIKTASGSLHAR